MALQVILHVHNEDPFVADIEAMPDPTHQFLKVTNPRRRDGKPLATLQQDATAVLYPWSRIFFVEVLGKEETGNITDGLMSFFREDGARGR